MIIIIVNVDQHLLGGWAYPSEKYESQLGWWNSLIYIYIYICKKTKCSKPPTSFLTGWKLECGNEHPYFFIFEPRMPPKLGKLECPHRYENAFITIPLSSPIRVKNKSTIDDGSDGNTWKVDLRNNKERCTSRNRDLGHWLLTEASTMTTEARHSRIPGSFSQCHWDTSWGTCSTCFSKW